jgi:pantoate--beta-alanine ligase
VDVIDTVAGFRTAADLAREAGRTVGLVPTMGFFHDGHLSLIRRARADRDVVAVSIFVNPLQFGPNEDFASYPRDVDRDLTLAEAEGVDLVFAPPGEEMYPDGPPRVTVDPGPLADRYEGAVRPGHFRGVLTVVAKLFHAVGPCAAYFGEKDAQQLMLVRRMAADLSFPVEVVGCPIVREPDGLALSSRNVYLSPEERTAAIGLSRGLRAARAVLGGGDRDAVALVTAIRSEVEREPLAALDYAVVVDDATFDEIDRVERPARALVAARVGRPRLIDNLLLEP